MFDVICEEVNDFKNLSFLDAGCSYGYMDFILTDLGAWTMGMDVIDDKIKIAKDLAYKYGYRWYNPLFTVENVLEVPICLGQDYTIFFNLMHHIGLWHSPETAWKLLNAMVSNSKKVFLMVRVHWERGKRVWHIADDWEAAKEVILEKSGAHWLHDYGVVHRWQGRSICVLGCGE